MRKRAGSAYGAACLFFPFSEWRTKKSPKGSGHAAALWAAIPPAAAGTAQDAAEAAQRQAFLKWTQGEAMTAQEKQLVDDLWNTDPAKASEYWAAGEFLDTEVPGVPSLDGGGLDGTMEKRRTNIQLNAQRGRNFEQKNFSVFSGQFSYAEEQVTLRTKQGTRIRVDAIGLEKETDRIVIYEYKSSASARLTKNQKQGFPQLYLDGGAIAGKGKGYFHGGLKIPSGTKVRIIRPHMD